MLLRQANTEDRVVSTPSPFQPTSRQEDARMNTYAVIYRLRPCSVRSETVLPSIFTSATARGLRSFFPPASRDFIISTNRETLMPPPVDPAHAPTIIRIISTQRENSGQRLKSTVA